MDYLSDLGLNSRWLLPEPIPQTVISDLAQQVGVSPPVVEVLYRRGLQSAEAIRAFLTAKEAALHDPFALPDIEPAVQRLLAARANQEPVVIYGDYDCDGITSTFALLSVFRAAGLAVDYYIPNRLVEGYGLNSEAVGKLAQNYRLLISVDCGISAHAEVELATSLGLDVIITDHHTPGAEVPTALAVINPKLPTSRYPFPELAGVGVAFQVARAFWVRACPDKPFPVSFAVPMLGTVADMVPLVGENRVLVAKGLAELPHAGLPGLLALIAEAGRTPEQVSAGIVAFNLAPRMNAAGRLGRADLALNLLQTTDQAEAAAIAAELSRLNAQRQQLEDEILAQARLEAERTLQPGDKAIVVAGEGWHSGVIGIVASRLVEEYSLPAVVISLEGGEGHGSCRSVPGLNIYEALSKCADDLLGFGGHSGAAGLTIAADKIDEFRRHLCTVLDGMISAADLVPTMQIDLTTDLASLSEHVVHDLALLEPFGCDNPQPLFAVTDLEVVGARRVGKDQSHLKLEVQRDGRVMEAIGFGLGDWADLLDKYCGLIDLAFVPEINEWRDRRCLQLQVKALRIREEQLSPIDRLFIGEAAAATDPYANIGDAEEFYTKAVGVTFEGRQAILATLQRGERLRLAREPHNPHDPNAIALITASGEQIGYLKRELARHLAPLMDAGVEYEASVSEVTGQVEGRSLGVNLFVQKKSSSEDYLAWLETRSFREQLARANEQELLAAIKKAIVGSHEYRPKQLEALQALNQAKNTLLIMGTGRGKTAVFQSMAALLALREHKATIIIYPLRALVNDQYRSMQAKLGRLGVRIYKATGTLSTREREDLYSALYLGEAEVILATPEFVQCNLVDHPGLREKLGLFVVDESHHIGKIGAARPAYRNLDKLHQQLGLPLTLAVTATADDTVAAAIRSALSIEQVIIDPHRRTNLHVIDRRGLAEEAKFAYLVDLVASGEKTVIYVNSREGAANLAHDLRKTLKRCKDRIAFYHGGLANSHRKLVEELFAQGELRAVVSTSAFGEGVDIPDIRHVIHYHLTFNLTDFNQQSGRAGRDGESAWIHLLYNQQDVEINRFILRSKAPDREVLAALYRVLTRVAGPEGEITLTNGELAEAMLAYLDQSAADFIRPTPETVSAALGILYELKLLWREKTGVGRVIYLAPRPAGKLDLTESVRYNEGIIEREAFEGFQHWALTTPAQEMLAMINKPIYPVQAVD